MCKLHKVSKGSCCYVPLIPTTPHTAAGIRIDPPPSVPKATGHRPEEKQDYRKFTLAASICD